MNETSTTLLNDIAHALHDSVRRFTAPLHPCPEATKKLMKEQRISLMQAWEKAPKVPREMHTFEIEQIEMWQQTWGSTALGFGGFGGAAMTTANVIVVTHNGESCVYFGSRFAYRAPMCAALANDIAARRMADVKDSGKYTL